VRIGGHGDVPTGGLRSERRGRRRFER
jgi:hypothetical protein